MAINEQNPSKLVWNQADLLERVDNDQELLRELLTIFKEDFPRTLHSLDAAVAAGDFKRSATLSHTLKGMLSNLGGIRAAEAAAKLESMAASSNGKESLVEALNVLQQEAASLLPELDAYIAGVLR